MGDIGNIDVQEQPRSTSTQAPAVNTTMSVLALVFGIIMAPVGLILGIIDLVKARKEDRKPSVLAIVGTILGGVGTVGAIACTIVLFALVGNLQTTGQFDAMCARASADRGVFTESISFLETIPLPSEMTADDAIALASQASSLTSRLRAIPGNVGTAYLRIMNAGHTAGDRMGEVEMYLTDLAASGFSVPIDTTMAQSDISYFENEVLTTCP